MEFLTCCLVCSKASAAVLLASSAATLALHDKMQTLSSHHVDSFTEMRLDTAILAEPMHNKDPKFKQKNASGQRASLFCQAF